MLGAFLNRFDTGGLGVNIDPANLLMGGFDPYESARALHGWVVRSNAKDARVTWRKPDRPGGAAGSRRHRMGPYMS